MLRRAVKRTLAYVTATGYHTLNRIELSGSRVLHNVALIQGQHPGFEVIPVLKGNAYGHGIEQIAEILNDASCRLVAVDGYFEAVKIRDITKHHILVMGYILPENVQLLDTKRCSFVVQDIQGLIAFGALSKPVDIHLELNTGFNRLGLELEELPAYLKTLKTYPTLNLEGIMTHLADADNELDESYTAKQLRAFDDQVSDIIAAGFNPKFVHIAQTAGSTKVVSRYANAIRLGIGVYGINPLSLKDSHYKDLASLQPVLELKSTIIKVLDLHKGEKVGYNGTFTASRLMRLGVLPLGYYEGVPRELSNKGCVTHNGVALPIVGRVCMNHTMVDLKIPGYK
jgi:alanine racemase